jgi:hypothetical protein
MECHGSNRSMENHGEDWNNGCWYTDANIKKIFSEKPHSTWDDYFSGDHIMNWLGNNGLAAAMTCCQDRFPATIPGEYFPKKKTETTARSKAARFLNKGSAVMRKKNADNQTNYVRLHCAFQSISTCNISTVNALNHGNLEGRTKGRGRGNSKRYWGIEMNDTRNLYLGTYSRIHSIDHLVKNANLFYQSWKFRHSPMLHAKSLAVVVAWDMYLLLIF